jgi:hypothetical protein
VVGAVVDVVVVVVGGIAGIEAQKRLSTVITSGSGAPKGWVVPSRLTNPAGDVAAPPGAAGSGGGGGGGGGGGRRLDREAAGEDEREQDDRNTEKRAPPHRGIVDVSTGVTQVKTC